VREISFGPLAGIAIASLLVAACCDPSDVAIPVLLATAAFA
jgi:hypothetical protein